MEQRESIVAVVRRGERVLVIQRGPLARLPGYWAPLSGKLEPGETQEEAVVREVHEEVGLRGFPLAKVWQWQGEVSDVLARQAYERGYQVVFGADVTATDDDSRQEPELGVLRKGFALVLRAEEIMDWLSGADRAPVDGRTTMAGQHSRGRAGEGSGR
ncbi:NUDIX hydrolase [Streptomyces sp. NPDC000070]|uniref:NUDIX hydrolase n=1 Tax=Streptomyces sp. NPDC000070 TaxID=3154240 RepID=UPI0033285794